MRYADYDNVQGRSGGPFLDELELLSYEKECAAAENRDPDYLQFGFTGPDDPEPQEAPSLARALRLNEAQTAGAPEIGSEPDSLTVFKEN